MKPLVYSVDVVRNRTGRVLASRGYATWKEAAAGAKEIRAWARDLFTDARVLVRRGRPLPPEPEATGE